jgi:hypothetical protein
MMFLIDISPPAQKQNNGNYENLGSEITIGTFDHEYTHSGIWTPGQLTGIQAHQDWTFASTISMIFLLLKIIRPMRLLQHSLHRQAHPSLQRWSCKDV